MLAYLKENQISSFNAQLAARLTALLSASPPSPVAAPIHVAHKPPRQCLSSAGQHSCAYPSVIRLRMQCKCSPTFRQNLFVIDRGSLTSFSAT
jgi:hypothetical protein